MSKHNYSQYSKKNDSQKAGVNANAFDNNRKEQKKHEYVEKIPTEVIKPIAPAPEVKMVVETVETVSLPKFVEGVVVNCAKLNVREEPSTNSDIVCVLDVMSEIEIDVEKSTDEWFKICTAIGVEGYCMRKFVDARL